VGRDCKRKNTFGVLVQILLTSEDEHIGRFAVSAKTQEIAREEDNSAEIVIFSYKKS
jgi:hypothetical protein